MIYTFFIIKSIINLMNRVPVEVAMASPISKGKTTSPESSLSGPTLTLLSKLSGRTVTKGGGGRLSLTSKQICKLVSNQSFKDEATHSEVTELQELMKAKIDTKPDRTGFKKLTDKVLSLLGKKATTDELGNAINSLDTMRTKIKAQDSKLTQNERKAVIDAVNEFKESGFPTFEKFLTANKSALENQINACIYKEDFIALTERIRGAAKIVAFEATPVGPSHYQGAHEHEYMIPKSLLDAIENAGEVAPMRHPSLTEQEQKLQDAKNHFIACLSNEPRPDGSCFKGVDVPAYYTLKVGTYTDNEITEIKERINSCQTQEDLKAFLGNLFQRHAQKDKIEGWYSLDIDFHKAFNDEFLPLFPTLPKDHQLIEVEQSLENPPPK
jgi:hypothetical protein